jgi:23S rRNA (cytidine1920-2'-O)/16S rRNA (cytidine1409-2'-O)-methyltransferase
VSAVKERIDLLLVARGLAESRARAQGLLLAGQVLVNDVPVDKPGTRVAMDATVRLRGADHPYVGRGGLKLEGALQDLGIDPRGWRCLDVGASTGGFTDCLLQHGAAHVIAVDVGTNQLAWRLRQDPRVLSLEGTDVRALRREDVGEIDLVVVDASFISLRLVLPPLPALLRPGTPVVALVKPQFEVGRDRVGRGGVVRDDGLRAQAVDGIVELALGLGFAATGRADCRLAGAKSGNREVFLALRAGPAPADQKLGGV